MVVSGSSSDQWEDHITRKETGDLAGERAHLKLLYETKVLKKKMSLKLHILVDLKVSN